MKALLNDSQMAVGILENLGQSNGEKLSSDERQLLRRVGLDLLSFSRAPHRNASTQNNGDGEGHLLSKREAEVAQWIAQGLTDGEIASILGISTRTVNTHRDSLLRKLNVRSRASIASWAARHLLLPTCLFLASVLESAPNSTVELSLWT